ncbi:putative ornithine cyclodeaminase [Bacillus sp. TS-2]|nr:putative ornithine cyclodeaminase [Bacillus sp. TS-2]
MTIILSDSDIKELINQDVLIEEIREAFIQQFINKGKLTGKRVYSKLPDRNGTAMVLFPGYSEPIPAFTIKNHSKFPESSQAIKGIIHLFDRNDGQLLSVMDSRYITKIRTGIAGALGTHLLARKSAKKVVIIGAGVQGEIQLRSLLKFRDISHVTIYDYDLNKANALAKIFHSYDFEIRISDDLQDAVHEGDIIITATWSKAPFLFSNMVQPGTHITTLGPDEKNKAEVSAELIKRSFFIADDKELAISMGAIGGVGLGEENIHAELGEVLYDLSLGRTHSEQITVYGMVGLPFLDLIAAWHVYQRAKNSSDYLHFQF